MMRRYYNYCWSTAIGLLLYALFLFSSVAVSAQQGLIKKDFLEIKPGITTREYVENKFGQDPNATPHHAHYKKPGLFINITYGYGCTPGMPWEFPKDLVKEVSYSPTDDNSIQLKDVILRRSKFKKNSNDGHLPALISYHNDSSGIIVTYDEEESYVDNVRLIATPRQKEHYKCKEQ